MSYDSIMKIKEEGALYPHIPKYDLYKSFLDRVIYCYLRDSKFAELVDRQLSLYYQERVHIMDFYETCNIPGHLIRERMIVWDIDHPEEKEKI